MAYSWFYSDDDFFYERQEREIKGGQHVGVPLTGVTCIHAPTGLKAFSKWERSQHANRTLARAMVEFGLLEIGYSESQ